MSSQRRLSLMMIILLMLVLSACERPFQADTGIDPLAQPAETTAEEPETADPAVEGEGEVAEATAEPVTEGESPRPEATAEVAEESVEEVAEEPAEESAEEAAEEVAEEPAEEAPTEVPVEEPAPTEVPAEEPAPTEVPAEEAVVEPTAEPTAEPTTPATTNPETGQRVHVVQAGENLFRIGLLYDVSWVVIADANNITDPTRVLIGDELVIPSENDPVADPAPTPTDDNTYTVLPGDTLFEIGQSLGVDWRLIAEANGIVNPNSVVAGTLLKIPSADEPGVTPEFTHLVETGETLFLISLNYGVTWDSIAEANDIAAPYIIYPGEELVIPSSSDS